MILVGEDLINSLTIMLLLFCLGIRCFIMDDQGVFLLPRREAVLFVATELNHKSATVSECTPKDSVICG
jgi:hypothetical protein